MKETIRIHNLDVGADGPFFAIAGPCVIEDEEVTLEVARFLKKIGGELGLPVIFKASYDKANRTALSSYRGPGVEQGLEVLKKVKADTGLPILSDVHGVGEVERASKVLDVIQIPAFLCRQTDLVVAAARTGLPLNLKKGQFLSPWQMRPAIEKVTSTGNRGILLTERGVSFGYHNLVVDMRSIAIMKGFGYPVVFDATHSVQLPGADDDRSGGEREFVGVLARAAVAAGADGVFMEIHPAPDAALCDGANSLSLHEVKPLLGRLREIHRLVKS